MKQRKDAEAAYRYCQNANMHNFSKFNIFVHVHNPSLVC